MPSSVPSNRRPDVAAYWFGNWHRDPRMEEWLGAGWTEWELVRHATPRFPGHKQPIVPQWGYTDDLDPDYLKKSCRAAFDAGIDAFLVDWYWYDGPFLNKPLDDVLLGLDTPLKFAVMWANHDWKNAFPAPRSGAQDMPFLASAAVDLEGFRTVTQFAIDHYMTSPRYWRVDGAAYYSIFMIGDLIDQLGGVEQTAAALADMRRRAREAGVGEVHLAAVTTDVLRARPELYRQFAALGIDSVNDYNWNHFLWSDQVLGQEPLLPYSRWRETAVKQWSIDRDQFDAPVAPNVSIGWDSTPRTPEGEPVRCEAWPYLPVVVDNTPEELEVALRDGLAFLRESPTPPYLTLNAWNEWTEGAYLEPDNHWGSSKLDAVRNVLGRQ
jgi:hypothetical protein